VLSSAAALLDGLFEQPAGKMPASTPWSIWNSLIAATMMIVAVFDVSAQADSPKKHRSPCKIHYPSDATLEWNCRIIPPGGSLEAIFGEYWVDVARFNRIDRRHAHSGVSIKVPKRLEDLAQFTPLPLVYPPGELDEKFILIDLSEQFLGAYEFGALRFATPIASGNGLNETPSPHYLWRFVAKSRSRQARQARGDAREGGILETVC
jgi:hypothetical protein